MQRRTMVWTLGGLCLWLGASCGDTADGGGAAAAGSAGMAAGAGVSGGGPAAGSGGSSGAHGDDDAGVGGAGIGSPAFPEYWSLFARVDESRFLLTLTNQRFGITTGLYDWSGNTAHEKSQRFMLMNNLSDFSFAETNSLVLDPSDQGAYLAGSTQRPFLGGTQMARVDNFLVKLDEAGDLVRVDTWPFEDGPTFPSHFQVLTVTAEGDVLTLNPRPGPSATLFATLTKRDKNGAELWTLDVEHFKRFDELYPGYSYLDRNVSDTAAVVTPRGTTYLWSNVFLGGTKPAAITNPWLLSKVSADGVLLWTKKVEEPCATSTSTRTGSNVLDLAINDDETALYALGSCLIKLDGNAVVQWSKPLRMLTSVVPEPSGVSRWNPYELVLSTDEKALFAMVPLEGAPAGATDRTLSRFEADGTASWTQSLDVNTHSLVYEPSSDKLIYVSQQDGGDQLVRASAKTGTVETVLP